MGSSLFSSSWYKVKSVKPRLRRQAKIVRQTFRSEVWYVIQDMASGRFMRLDLNAYRVICLFDGIRDLDGIWLNLCESLGDQAPTQDELINLLTQLHQANVLTSQSLPDLEELKSRRKQSKKAKLKQYIGNPLSLKMPILDPDRFLSGMVRHISSRVAAFIGTIWLLVVISGFIKAAYEWDELTHDIASQVFTSENMFMLWLAFPLLKVIHELGHGLAIKILGGSCREMGLLFLLAIPVPYVDASSATMFPNKRHRMLVGMAGMFAELFIAAILVWFWSYTSSGPVKAFFHQAIILASVTTLFFNLNPLLRFDGYYVLADWLEIPNLAQKSNRYLGYLIQRHIFRVGERLDEILLTPKEGWWLVSYSIGSFFYRTMVAVVIVLSVAERYFFVGALLAMWAFVTMLVLPALKVLKHVVDSPVLVDERRRALWVTFGSIAVLLAMIGLLPVPNWTMSEGVIWMSDRARVNAPFSCFGGTVLAKPGQIVKNGEPLLSCVDPELQTRLEQTRHRVDELKSRVQLATVEDRVQLGIAQSELAFASDSLRDLEGRLSSLVITSAHDGVFFMDAPNDFSGRFADRGEVLAYVIDAPSLSLLTIVPQGEVDLVRSRTEKIELRSADRPMLQLPARILREVPAATKDLPSLALSLQGGGTVGVDPSSTGADSAPKALNPLFQFEVQFTGVEVPEVLGGRVYVRFVHRSEPLAMQWYRTLRQLFLKRFAV